MAGSAISLEWGQRAVGVYLHFELREECGPCLLGELAGVVGRVKRVRSKASPQSPQLRRVKCHESSLHRALCPYDLKS